MTVRISPSQRHLLLECLIRIERLETSIGTHEDLSAVRRELETLVGPTLGRASAAKLLGVSQTALDRWVASGDIPVVISISGRREIPLRAFLQLAREVLHGRSSEDVGHPLARALRQQRKSADRLDVHKILPPKYHHKGIDSSNLRGLAYHRAVAQVLDDYSIKGARDRLQRWRVEGKINPRYADQWERILSSPPSRIARIISTDNERLRDLRQNSPFAGTLSEHERNIVLSVVG